MATKIESMHPKGLQFLEFVASKYRDDAVGFAEDVLGLTLSPNQQEKAMRALSDPDGKRSVAVVSGHGTGKSFMETVIIIWFLCTRPNARVVLTAPTSRQIHDVLMSEISRLYNQSILAKMNLFIFTKDRIKMNVPELSNSWFASAISVSNPEAFSGSHAENILMVFDEGAGIPSEIFERSEGVLTTAGSYMITCGNPSFTSGYFYDIFHNDNYAATYDLFTFNAEDSPNVEDDWIEMMKDKYGEDSNVYKVRVLGEFAPLDEEIIIRRENVKRAIGRELVEKGDTSRLFIGIDVSAGESNDFTVISIRKGYQEIHREKIKRKLRDLKNHIIMVISRYINDHAEVIVNIDTTGIGVQLGQDLSDHYYYSDIVEINEINFSQKAKDHKQYSNVFTEMFFGLNSIIEKVSLKSDPDLNTEVEEDLGSRKYSYDNKMRYLAEKKRDWSKRFNRSPDVGDAILLAFYDRSGWNDLTEHYYDTDDWR